MELSSQKYSFMVILAGDSGVGKTNIVLRYTKDNIPSNIEPSENFKLFFKSQKINGKKIRLQIWDLAGQQGWEEEAIPRLCSKSQGGFIIYDITKRESFENVQSWIQDCRNQSPKTIIMVLVGNKNDLENERDVSFDEGEQFAKNNNMIFYETSAKTGKNVNEIFENTVNNISKKIEENYYDLENDSCGIKVGMIEGNLYNSINNNNNISLDFDDKKEENYGCC